MPLGWVGEGRPQGAPTHPRTPLPPPSPGQGRARPHPHPSQPADYEDLVLGAGHWARAPPERPHGNRAALARQPIAGLPVAQGRGQAAHQAAKAQGRGGWDSLRAAAPLPLGCRRSPGPGCPSFSSSSSGQSLLPPSSCRPAPGSTQSLPTDPRLAQLHPRPAALLPFGSSPPIPSSSITDGSGFLLTVTPVTNLGICGINKLASSIY